MFQLNLPSINHSVLVEDLGRHAVAFVGFHSIAPLPLRTWSMESNSHKYHVITYRTKSLKERKWWWIRYGLLLSFWEIIVTNQDDSDSNFSSNYSGLTNSLLQLIFFRFGKSEECSIYIDERWFGSSKVNTYLLI